MNSSLKRICVLAILLGSLHSTAAWGGTSVTQTFDELAFQPIDDLSYEGAFFDFKIGGSDSTDAHYGSFGPIATEHVTDPSLVGNALGTLSIDFDVPTPSIEFGLALNKTGPIQGAVQVGLFDVANQLLDEQLVYAPASNSALGFSSMLFRYDGVAVRRMVLSFSDEASSFALDNFKYIVPEPVVANAVVMACLILLHDRRRRIVP